MSRRVLRAGVTRLGFAALAALAGACAQVLGLDDSLESDGGSTSTVLDTDSSGGGHGGDGGDGGASPDATVDGATSDAGPGTRDAAIADALATGAWHVDPSFTDTGCYQLLTVANGNGDYRPTVSGLTLVSAPGGRILTVGITADDTLVVHDLAAPSMPLVNMDLGANGRLDGVGVTSDGRVLVLADDDEETSSVYRYLIDLSAMSGVVTPGSFPKTDLTIANLVDASDGNAVEAVGAVEPETTFLGADITVGPDASVATTLSVINGDVPNVVKAKLTTAGGDWYGGMRTTGSGTTAVYGFDPGDGGATVVPVGPVAGYAAALTALVPVGGQVYGLGFVDSAFLFAPVSQEGKPPTYALLPSGGSEPLFTVYSDTLTLDYPYQLQAAVDGQERILVGGDFGGVQLGNFVLDGGSDDAAFEETVPDGAVDYAPAVDLAKYLPGYPADSWFFQSMLLQGDNLYVAVADNMEHQWAVVRLVRSAAR